MEGVSRPNRGCVACGYDVSALAGATCPECGYTATPEDLALAERRAWYLDATRWNVWVVSISVIACGALLSGALRDLLGVVWFSIIALSFALAHTGGMIVSRSLPRDHRRSFRRAWQMALVYWTGSAVLAIVAFQFFIESGGFYQYWRFREERWVAVGAGVQLIVLVLTVPLWYRCWRRASHAAGVPEAFRTRAKFRRGVLLAVAPALPFAGLFLIGSMVMGAMALLDRFFPGWELGR